jgi:hypothetical protein
MQRVTCAACDQPLAEETFNTRQFTPCPACARPARADVFPALFKQLKGESTGAVSVSEAEASCFYHPQSRARVACENCGRFLCALCDLELNGRHLCSACLNAGKKKGKLRDLERERVLYDHAALTIAVLPLLAWPLTILSAPAVVYIVIRYWNAPGSIVRRARKLRFSIAMIIALAQIAGWIALLYYMIGRLR